MKIGFFDSGRGGLSVVHQARKQMPRADFLFYADTDHVPYGEKTREEVTAFTRQAVAFLHKQGAGAVVIACNTATSAAIDTLREEFSFPILGMEPAVKPAAQQHGQGRILVLATPITVKGEKLKRLLETTGVLDVTDLCPAPGLVRLAESGVFTGPDVETYLDSILSGLDSAAYTQVVLGCTHFNYFKDTLCRRFPNAEIVDGSGGTVRRLMEVCAGLCLDGQGETLFFQSGRPVTDPEELEKISRLLARLEEMEKI